MTVRMATCRELSENKEEVKRLGQLYNIMERSATPTALLLPWFPSRAKKTKQQATTDLYMKFNDYIDMRRKAVPSSDAFDVLIAEGCDNATIIGFTLGVIFAGVINTRVNSCWVLVYLAANPSWKSQVNEEVKQLLAKYSDESSGDKLHQRLSSIPVSAWEDEMPVLDLVIRETIRLTLTGAALRRNMEEDLYVEGKRIDRGAFMAYPLGSVHMNPEIYTEPSKFDPSRFTSGREEDKKGTFSYIGWGVGRHPCTGMKVAKLEMKLIVALFLAGYEYELVDAAGKFPDPFPQPDRNDISEARPLGDPCYLKFRRTVA
ncbi:cytochrome P450 [Punctularia strigosozonata HHB-11173 SS5]|uniref:cytochrome P450 n=1 Tax=Punctularia strigosozonata (strain HHB-11173) TaxID=741275 RepID=UPI0004417746|nr:cytochrome P450 [Punctularia strigosozonata HHB-11173 SS5]EIN08261.1 cytochrome P450 [Punctularia strigosozonata HHB-11173 SS5]